VSILSLQKGPRSLVAWVDESSLWWFINHEIVSYTKFSTVYFLFALIFYLPIIKSIPSYQLQFSTPSK
jgi:hypothetical protein